MNPVLGGIVDAPVMQFHQCHYKSRSSGFATLLGGPQYTPSLGEHSEGALNVDTNLAVIEIKVRVLPR